MRSGGACRAGVEVNGRGAHERHSGQRQRRAPDYFSGLDGDCQAKTCKRDQGDRPIDSPGRRHTRYREPADGPGHRVVAGRHHARHYHDPQRHRGNEQTGHGGEPARDHRSGHEGGS